MDKERQILQRFCSEPVDGIILQPEYSSQKWVNMDLMKKLERQGTKFLFMDSRYPDPELSNIPCVSMDNYNPAYHICAELIQTGHKSIGGLFRLRSAQIVSRFDGVRQAIVDGGIPYNESAFLLPENSDCLKRLLDETAFDLLKKQEAVVCGTGEYASYLFEMLQQHGRGNIRTVVIFDEVPLPTIQGISFITLKYAGEEIGRLCAEKILNEIQGVPESSVEIPWTILRNPARDSE